MRETVERGIRPYWTTTQIRVVMMAATHVVVTAFLLQIGIHGGARITAVGDVAARLRVATRAEGQDGETKVVHQDHEIDRKSSRSVPIAPSCPLDRGEIKVETCSIAGRERDRRVNGRRQAPA